MVSVKQCVFILVLSLCISSIIVDSHRVRKHRRRDSRGNSRLPQKRYRYDDSKTSRFEDCVDCESRFENDEDDYREHYHTNRRKSKIRRRKKESKSETEKGSSYSLWNIFNTVSGALWSSDDSEQEKAKDDSKRKNRRRGRRKGNRNDRGRADGSRYVEGKRRNRPDTSREMYARFQGAPKARKHKAPVERRGRNRAQYNQRGRHEDDDGSYEQPIRRKGNRGRNNRRRKPKERMDERGRNYQKIERGLRKGSRFTSQIKTTSPPPLVNRPKNRGKERRRGRGKPHQPEKDLPQEGTSLKQHKKNKPKNKLHGKKQNKEEDSIRPVSRQSKTRKPKKKKDDKEVGQVDQSDSYPLVRAELYKVDEIEKKRKKKHRKNKKDRENNNKDETKPLASENAQKKTSSRNSGKEDKNDKKESIQKGRRKGKKSSAGQRNGKRTKKKKAGRIKAEPEAKDKSLIKGKSSPKKSLSSKNDKEEKVKKTPSNDEEKDSEEEKEKKPSSSGKKKKRRRKKKGKNQKASEKESSTHKNKDTVTKDSSKKKKKTNAKSENVKLESGKKGSLSSEKTSGTSKKETKRKSRKRKKGKGRSSVNKAFSVLANAQKIGDNEMKSNQSISKTEAERQVDALTDEQLVYALKVAEKRFKRTDRRIKKKLSALKEMTMQHLHDLDTLEMSMDQRAFPVKSNPMSNSNSSSLHSSNRISFYDNKDEISPSDTSFDIKSDAKSFLKFASLTSKKMSKFLAGESIASRKNDGQEVSKKKPTENPLTPNSNKFSSSSEDNSDNSKKKSSSNGSRKKSGRKSGRKRKNKKGRKKAGSINRKKEKSSLSVSNIFGSESVQKKNTDSKGKKLRDPPQNPKVEDKDEGKVLSDSNSKSQRGRSQGGRSQTGRSQGGRSQGGRSQGGWSRGNRRYDRYQYTKNRQKNRQIQMVLPRLNRSIREITRRLYHVIRPFTTNIKLSDSYYHAIFNATRYDVISGAREILKDINKANDDVYDAVMRSSHLARSIYMKAHRERAAQRRGVPNAAAAQRAVESKVKMKDFRPFLVKLREEQNRMESHTRDLHMMEMKSRELKSRRIQVRERFLEKYDHQSFRHIFDNMRSTIAILNNGLQISYPLKQLHTSKKYVKSVTTYVATARDLLTNSSHIYRNGMRKFMENERLIWNVKKGKRDVRQKKMQSDSPGPGLTRGQFRRLEQWVVKTQKHAQRLNRERNDLQRFLGAAIRNAKIALQRSGRGNVVRGHVDVDLRSLKSVYQGAVMALDQLRKFIGGQIEITLASLRGCRPRSGFGNMETDDEDFGCEEEGSGVEGSGEMSFADHEDDFTFDGDFRLDPVSKPNPLQLLGKKLKVFTTNILNTSQRQFGRAQVIQRSLEDLKDGWRVHEETSAATNLQANFNTMITEGLDAAKSNSTKILAKIEAINKKINDLNEIDFEELKNKAKLAIESAKQNMKDSGEDETEDIQADEDTTAVENDYDDESDEIKEFGITDLLSAGETIAAHRDSIKNLQTFAVDTIEKSSNRLKLLRGNITQLWEKVKIAKNLLNSMQLSILKEGKSPIVSTALSDDMKVSKSVTTSFSLCIKPQSLDGTVLYSVGNDSISYALKLSDGELSALVYDEDYEELTDITLEEKLEEDKWHTISLLRVGQTLNLTATREDKFFTESVEVDNMPEHQSAPSRSYIGGLPGNMKMDSDESWEGCVSELLVNDKSMDLFSPTMDRNSSSLCSEHCASQGQKLSWIFDGGGFVHYSWDPWQNINSLSLQFRSKQPHAAILSAAHERRRFHLLVTLKNGAVQIESATRMENVVLLSLNNTFNDGKNHTLKIFFRDRGIYPDLDGAVAAFSVENSRPTVLKNVRDGILLGGFVSEEKFLGNVHRPLIGCASISSINGKALLYDGISQSHNVYYGKCTMSSVWQSCIHFPDTSQPLSLGELDNSNTISMLVSRNSTGPLLLYVKEDKFEIALSLTEDGIDVTSADSEGELIRSEDYRPNELFDVITVEDTDEDQVIVRAFGESTKFSYGSWITTPDPTLPHTIEIGQTRDETDRAFTLSISEFVIGGRFYDLTKHSSTHTLKACELPDTYLKRNFPTEATNNNLNSFSSS